MRRLAYHHFELAVFVVAARTAANERAIVFRPVIPVIPKSRMQTDQPFTVLHMAEDCRLRGRVGERLVVADDQYIHPGNHVSEPAGCLGVVGADAADGVERFDVGDVEPALIIMARSATDDERLETGTPLE